MGSIANNIQSFVRTLKEMLDSKKYQVDYFQREYKWEKKHIEQLLVDLEASFNSNYEDDHTMLSVEDYNCYYLGPVVISEKSSVRSIVDGQQRITSMTLLLIYLNNLQGNSEDKEELDSLIYSKKHGRRSYNIEVTERTKILDALFNDMPFDIDQEEDDSVRNMMERYSDIKTMFSEDLMLEKLPMFIDWLKEKVVFVEIIAYTDENAYTIFETMNDRGLNLTPTEMLKGYILTNVKDNERIFELNDIWKQQISSLRANSIHEDLEFIKAWMRGLYADTIRPSIKGAENEDFEKIGTRFHTWIKDNAKKLNLKDPDSYYYFIKGDFKFYSNIYSTIINAQNEFNVNYETLYLSSYWGIASSLSLPLLMASINKLDDEDTINRKIGAVSKFLDIYTIFRVFSNKSITQSSIRYFIYTLVKDVRNKELDALIFLLKERLSDLGDSASAIDEFRYYNSDKKFMQYLLARITYHIENKINKKDITFDELMVARKRNRFVVYPLISGTYEKYQDYFEGEDDYIDSYLSLGNYTLVPNQLAQEANDQGDDKKKLRVLNRSFISPFLCEISDDNDFSKWGFESISTLNKEAISMRSKALKNVILEIWSVDEIGRLN